MPLYQIFCGKIVESFRKQFSQASRFPYIKVQIQLKGKKFGKINQIDQIETSTYSWLKGPIWNKTEDPSVQAAGYD